MPRGKNFAGRRTANRVFGRFDKGFLQAAIFSRQAS
jgi:hypothetical protein